MTEFEAASLAAQHVALWIAAAAAAAAVVASVGIWHGIRAMVRANKERAVILDQQRQASERRHEEVMAEANQRHEEVMAAHAEAMAEANRRHEKAMAAHAEVMAGIASQRNADERRHEEVMAEANQRHEEAMAEANQRHEESMASLGGLIGGLERQTASLEAVVERTNRPDPRGFEEPKPGPAE